MNSAVATKITSKQKDFIQMKNKAVKNKVYETKHLNLWYGEKHALKDINLNLYENEVTAIIGPSGCGKSTYIKH